MQHNNNIPDPWRKRAALAKTVLHLADSLKDAGKICDGEYVDLADGAKILHQGIPMLPGDIKEIMSILETLSMKVKILKKHNKDLSIKLCDAKIKLRDAEIKLRNIIDEHR